VTTTTNPRPFLARHEFFVRRLHSLTGLVPVGAFMTVHLLANASILEGPGAFQKTVYQIHSLGALLPVVEWVFIFLPILFHGLLGLAIIRSGVMNTGTYCYSSNVRYMLQRASGIIAFLFIFLHVFHMHGWIHADAWVRNVVEPLGGGQFRPYSAPSTLGLALDGLVFPVLYAIGILTCVFHLCNGLWTMGITWGVWTSPAAQRRANYLCGGLGVFLGLVGLSALFGAASIDVPQARKVEDGMYSAKVLTHEIVPNDHKRAKN
jgi:succinate dehydrogenase / fumarate reductase cytochrome b subunit